MAAAGEEEEEEVATAFVETSLGTRLAVSFPADATTVAHLKRMLSDEHAATFPHIGRVAVDSFKVRRRGSWYHLADSVPVRAAFRGVKGAWHLQADLLPLEDHLPERGTSSLHLCSQQDASKAKGHLPNNTPSTDQEDEEPRGRKHCREEEEDRDHEQSALADRDAPAAAGPLAAALVCSVRQDDQDNRCRDKPLPKRTCAAREDVPLNEVDHSSVDDVVVLSSDDDDMLEDGEAAFDDSCCQDEQGPDSFEKKKKQEDALVSTSVADQAEPSVRELCNHETKSMTDDKGSKLCFPVNKNDFATDAEEHAGQGMAQEKKLVEQQDRLDNGQEPNPALCFSKVNKNDSTTATDELQNCNYHRSNDPLLHDLDECAPTSEGKPFYGHKEPSIAEMRNNASTKKGTEPPPCVKKSKQVRSSMAHKVEEKELQPARVCDGERSSKETHGPPCAGSMEEGASSEKDAMPYDVKGKGPWTARVCNGERSSKNETDGPPCVEPALKEVTSSGKEQILARSKVEEKEPWTARARDGDGIRIKGTDHPPRAGSTKEGNSSSSERQEVAPSEAKQNTRTVTLVDVDGTKWTMQLDDTFDLGPQESSSSSSDIWSDSPKPRRNAEECRPDEGTPENGGTNKAPAKRSDLPRHGSFKTPTSSGPTGPKDAEGTSAGGAEQGAWDGRRRPRHVVQKIPNSRAAKMYGYR